MKTDQPEPQDLDHWVRLFEEAQSRYKALGDAVASDLESVIRGHGFWDKVHGGIQYRIKDPQSFRGKLDRKDYLNPLEDMHDLVGVRIVCLYPSILGDIDKLIREIFEVVRYEDKSKGVAPELWRYSSIHYDCRMPATHNGPRYDPLKDMVFEIQVRTILQDAWATVEHKLGYKNEKSIPDELKREFSALAGLFHIADQRFQFIANEVNMSERKARDIVAEFVHLYEKADEVRSGNGTGEPLTGIEADIEELESRLEAAIDRGTLKALLRGRYTDRERAVNYQYSELVQELALAGIVDLRSLREFLREGEVKALTLEEDHPDFGSGGRFNDVGFARLAMSVASPEFGDVHRKRQERASKP